MGAAALVRRVLRLLRVPEPVAPQCPYVLLAQDDGPRWRLWLPCQRWAGHEGEHVHPSAAQLADASAGSWRPVEQVWP